MRNVITEKEVRRLGAGETLYIGEAGVLTSLAAEAARLQNIRIVAAPPPDAVPASAPAASGAKLCVNLPDREGATYVVKVRNGKVAIHEQDGDALKLQSCSDKRICRHNH